MLQAKWVPTCSGFCVTVTTKIAVVWHHHAMLGIKIARKSLKNSHFVSKKRLAQALTGRR